MKIVFFATPNIALETFEFFINSKDYDVKALVTQKPKAQNRGKKIIESNISLLAKQHSIDVIEPDKISKEPEVIEKLKSYKPDFFITFAFGQILSQEVIDIPKYATINLHASLLPKYRGANPIASAILNGDKYTGITTMKTALALDSGDICLQEKIEITPDMNVVELMDIISSLSPSLLDKTLKGIVNNSIEFIAQNEKEATFTKKLKKEDKIINWSDKAQNIHNKIRAMYKINTNHTTFKNKIIKILKTQITKSNITAHHNEIIGIDKEGITIRTSSADDAIKIIKVKPEGKSEMDAICWARGARIGIGDTFGG